MPGIKIGAGAACSEIAQITDQALSAERKQHKIIVDLGNVIDGVRKGVVEISG
jgi:hypothetical protein